MTLLTIAAHHLRRVARNPGLILLLMAIPITLGLIEYAAFGQSAASGRLPPVKVLILDEDDTFASRALPQVFASGPMKDFFEVAPAESLDRAKRAFERSEASALLVVPKGFQRALLAMQQADLQFYPNPIQTFSPQMADSALQMVTAIGNGLMVNAADPIARIHTLAETGREPTEEEVAEISRGFFRAGERFARLRALQNMKVRVERPRARAEASNPFSQDFFGYVFPGLVLFGLMFIAQALGLRLLRDRMQGRHRRVAVAPLTPATLVAGGVLYMIVASIVLLVLLGLIGSLIFGIELRAPLALMALGLGFAVFVTGLHLTINGLARSDRGAQGAAGVVIMVLSLLGGTFVPAESYPPFLRAVAFVVPNGAAQQGMIDVLVHQRSFAQIGGRLAVTWAWGLVLLASAVLAERRTVRRS